MLEKQELYFRTAWMIVLGGSIFRLIYSGTFLLVPDEAYYWQWSRYLDLGYHDHPPMIAWTIKLATLLLGHTETAVRLPSVLSLTITSLYVIAIARRWLGARASLYAALLTQSILGFNAAGLLAAPDGLQMAAWAGASYHVARAYDDGEKSQWLLGGVWFGFGMLSKYTMAIFPPLVLMFGLLSKHHRKKLASIWPYTGLILGSFMLLPVMIWNASHGWSTFRHIAYKGGVAKSFVFRLDYLGDYLVSQVVLLSPLIFILLVIVWFRPLKKMFKDSSWILTYCYVLSFPVIAGFALLSLSTRVEGNWSGPGYLAAVVIISAFMAQETGSDDVPRSRTRLQKLWPWAIGSSFMITALVLMHLLWPVLPIPARMDRLYEETRGWKLLGQKASHEMASMPRKDNTFLFGLRYQIASELAFYTPGRPKTVSINKWRRPNAYDYWWNDKDLMGWDAVGIVVDYKRHVLQLQYAFEYVSPPERIAIYRTGALVSGETPDPPVSEYYLCRAFGFKGGVKWMPPDTFDMRAN